MSNEWIIKILIYQYYSMIVNTNEAGICEMITQRKQYKYKKLQKSFAQQLGQQT